MSDSDCEDENETRLSSEALQALQEFYKEQELREVTINNLKCNPMDIAENSLFDENWQLSQFWYDDETVDTLASTIFRCVSSISKIALISCPTLFKKLKELFNNGEVKLFEYDERFSIYGNDFIFYDYKNSLNLSKELESAFDIVIADPPFLSEECLTKISETIKYLAKDKIIICTGQIMEEIIQRLLGLMKTKFIPHHKNNLANEFCCYSNFDFDHLII